jgi:predicted RND superfamily exporter protein
MWTELAHIVLKYRLSLIIILAVITAFMGYMAKDVEYSYNLATVVPKSDEDMQFFQDFRERFGEDGNVVAIGLNDSAIYQTDNFRRFKYWSEELTSIEGVKQVISLPLLQILRKDAGRKKFDLEPLFEEIPEDQATLDSLLHIAVQQRFYADQIVNDRNGATFVLLSLDAEILNSPIRNQVVEDIKHASESFEAHTGIDLRYVGLPYIRTEVNGKVKAELQVFLILSLIITALILLFFFRSWDAVLFPIIVIAVIVVWSMGTLGILGYEITMLTGLLPPVIVVIGIPNSIYLLNRYHQQINLHGNKIRALSHVIRKIGLVALITNFTTAVGFIVLAFTDIVVLREFGIVAGINILATFLVSIILIPAVFSYLPAPHGKQLKHLRFKAIDKVLTMIDLVVHRHKYRIFLVTGILVVISVIGLLQLTSVSFMVDDVPEDSQVKKDLEFFERNFSGIMPLEIVVHTDKKRGVLRQEFLEKVQALEDSLTAHPNISQPVSLVSFIKAARQAFYNGNPAYYELPSRADRNFVLRYLTDSDEQGNLLKSFVDSAQQTMRISFKVADIGSNRLDSLLQHVVQRNIDQIFSDPEIQAKATGTTLLFVKGNKFLVENLRMSLVLAFVIIAIIMGFLFRNARMIIISLIPNLIPMLVTAGIMGYFNVPLRPSTALIFSVVFGIAVDDAIHFLAKYRQELFASNFFVPLAVSRTIRETGASMIYTSIVLFAGFIIFAGSDFVGTTMLGVLTSTTLLIAMFSNLIVLPALLMRFDSGKRRRDSHPPIEHYDEFYEESEDEEIDLDLITLNGVPDQRNDQ